MARYSPFLGLQVEVQYRAGDILLPASGTFVGDTGRSIFLEQNFEQNGQHRHFRWEIPYPCIVRLAAETGTCGIIIWAGETALRSEPVAAQSTSAPNAKEEPERAEQEKSAVDGLKVSMIFPQPQRSNI